MADGLACFSTSFVVLSLSHFFLPCHKESLVFGISFHGSSFCFFRVDGGRHMQRSAGGIEKGERERRRDQSLSYQLCESAYQNCERQ